MADRLRGRAGQRQRLRRLKRTNGLCERCLEAGLIVEATVVDHIKPLALGGDDTDENTRNLCDDCNDAVTAEQFDHDRARSLGGCDERGLPTDPAHPWNRSDPRRGSKV